MALLEVKNLRVWFPVLGGFFRRKVDEVKAVDGVSFVVEGGQTVGFGRREREREDDSGSGATQAN